MNIEVLYFGKPRELAGNASEIIALKKGSSLGALVGLLKNKYGTAFSTELKGIRILVNGREYELVDGMQTVLNDNDTIAFLPMIFGG